MENTKINSTLKINVETPADFDATSLVKMTNTKILGKKFNQLFKSLFADYLGCSLDIQYQTNLQCNVIIPKLYFKVLPADDYKNDQVYFAFKPVGTGNGNDMIGRVNRVFQTANTGAKVEMTDDAKSALGEFLLNQNVVNGGKFDWTTCFKTIPSETGSCVVMFKLDIIALLTKLYGAKDEEGNEYAYQVAPTYPILSNVYKTGDCWGLHIIRLNKKTMMSDAEDLGFYMPNTYCGAMNNVILAD